MNAKLIPTIIIGVAIGTLIAIYVAYQVAQKQLAASGSAASLLGGASGLLGKL